MLFYWVRVLLKAQVFQQRKTVFGSGNQSYIKVIILLIWRILIYHRMTQIQKYKSG